METSKLILELFVGGLAAGYGGYDSAWALATICMRSNGVLRALFAID